MSATVHYLPTANIAPLPRKANVGKLPAGVAKFRPARRKVPRRASHGDHIIADVMDAYVARIEAIRRAEATTT